MYTQIIGVRKSLNNESDKETDHDDAYNKVDRHTGGLAEDSAKGCSGGLDWPPLVDYLGNEDTNTQPKESTKGWQEQGAQYHTQSTPTQDFQRTAGQANADYSG